MAPKTKHESGTSLSDIVGPGKPMSKTELPTLRASMQHGIYLQEIKLLQHGVDRKNYPVREMVKEIRQEVVACYQKANHQFKPPVIFADYSIERKLQVFEFFTY